MEDDEGLPRLEDAYTVQAHDLQFGEQIGKVNFFFSFFIHFSFFENREVLVLFIEFEFFFSYFLNKHNSSIKKYF